MSGGERTRADSALLAALTAGQTVEDAATTANVSPATVRRRLRDPGFLARLDGYRSEVLRSTADRLALATTTAVETLTAIATDPNASPSARANAAGRILAAAANYHDLTDLTARLNALEALLAPKDHR